jgi:hypothetical protein
VSVVRLDRSTPPGASAEPLSTAARRGILALVISGWDYGYNSMRIREVSVNSPAGVPIWPLKMLIPFGAGLLALQGVAEVLRCIQCLRDNRWQPRLHDVEELEKQLLEEHAKKAAQEGAQGAAR